MSQAKNSTEVLKAMEWILVNVGWTQRANFRDKAGNIIGSSLDGTLRKGSYQFLSSVCINGAALLVETTEQLREDAVARVVAELPKNFKPSSSILFNDDKNTTKKMVLSVIRRAIENGNKLG
jgi:hypothetical protein